MNRHELAKAGKTCQPVPMPQRPEGQPPASSRARNYQRTRQQHAAEIAEDYVEAIADLIDENGQAKVVDLARFFGVSHVTVIRTIQRLQEQQLVTTAPYRAIELTDAGDKLARASRDRHRLIVEFLRALGVSERRAEADAEGIEHHVSEETLAAMRQFSKTRSESLDCPPG